MSNQSVIKKEQQKEIAQLGDGNVFIKRTASGVIKAVHALMTLKETAGHIANIAGKNMITAQGYNELNKVASISIITPETLTLPSGNTVVNPYPIIDKESGTISKVWVKKMGIGFSPIGNIVITSSTLLYDIQMYFIQDLVKKVQYNKDAGRLCMEQMLTTEEKKKGVFYKIEGFLGVYADFNHKEIIKAIDTFIQNKLFAERKAQTICERNVLKKHPALSTVMVKAQGPDKNKVARVHVIGFTHDLTKNDLLRLAAQAEKGKEIEYEGHAVQVIDGYDEISEEDVQASMEDEEMAAAVDGDEEGSARATQSKSEEEPKDTKEESETKIQLISQVIDSIDILGEEPVKKILENNFNKPLEELNIKQLEMALKLISVEVDKNIDKERF